MRQAYVYVETQLAGVLEELESGYRFIYTANYQGPPISLSMPIKQQIYDFKQFPAFFEGLLPEGSMLEALLRRYKLDRHDYMGQILKVGHDVIGAVRIEAAP